MSLELRIRVGDDNSVKAGDECWVKYAVTNTGSDVESIADPDSDSDRAPTFYVRGGPAAGKFVVSPNGHLPARRVEIAPGETVESAFRLDDRIELPTGAYEAVAVLHPRGEELVSNRLDFKVLPLKVPSMTVTPAGLPAARMVYFSWIDEAGYWEQRITERGDVDRPPFDADSAILRLKVPAGAAEPWTPVSGVFPDEPQPLRWIFFRSGQRVTGKGPLLIELPYVDLPADAGPVEGAPVMGAQHRADLFYRTADALVAARFIDPAVTPQEGTGIVARAALPPGVGLQMRVAIDPPQMGTDRRHVILSEVRPAGLTVYHCTLSAGGELSGFRAYAWDLAAGLSAVEGFRPAVAVLADGTLSVRVLAADRVEATDCYVLDVVLDPALDQPAPVQGQRVTLAGKPLAARACASCDEAGQIRRAAAWWLEDGSVAASLNGGPIRTLQIRMPRSAPHDLVALRLGVYVVQVGELGIQLLRV